jgi:hypothetical protein
MEGKNAIHRSFSGSGVAVMGLAAGEVTNGAVASRSAVAEMRGQGPCIGDTALVGS